MNSSERVSLFSRAKNSFLAYKNGVFSWIKLLFIPSVAKRLPDSEYHFTIYKNNFNVLAYSVTCSDDKIQERIQRMKKRDDIFGFKCVKGSCFENWNKKTSPS